MDCEKIFSEDPTPAKEIKRRYIKLKKFTYGRSGALIYLVKDRQTNKKYIFEIAPIIKQLDPKKFKKLSIFRFKHEMEYRVVLILCQLNKIPGCFPKLYKYGILYRNPFGTSFDYPHIYLIAEYVGNKNLLQVLEKPSKDFTLKSFRLIMHHILDCYIKASKEIDFRHNDVKLDNIVLDKLSPGKYKGTLIDFGWSSSKKYPMNERSICFLYHLNFIKNLPIFRKLVKSYNIDKPFYDPTLLIPSKVKCKYGDLNSIIHVINTGERILKGKELIFTPRDYVYFNSDKVKFYKKLERIQDRYQKQWEK